MALVDVVHTILYVEDQHRSASFWQQVLDRMPRLDVPGMTEFELREGCILGLMPEASIERLLPDMPQPSSASGIPRAELYLLLEDPRRFHARAMAAGARELSPLEPRAWGHDAAYSIDLDGHVIAFARRTTTAR